MILLGILGIISLILSLLHFFSPKTVLKSDEFGKKVVVMLADVVRKHPKILGIFYLICAIILIYVGFFWKLK